MNQTANGPVTARAALVAVDDPVLRRLMAAILRQQGFRVIEARSMAEGKQAVTAAGCTPALLVACLEARRSGEILVSVARFLIRDPRLRIIVTSASNPEAAELEIMQTLGIQFLSLPYSFSQFSRAVGECAGASTRDGGCRPIPDRRQLSVQPGVGFR